MKLTFLGTGTSTGVPQIACNCAVCTSNNPYDKRLRASVLIETASESILIDCGPDFRQQVLTNSIRKITAVLLTHGHYDHVGGLDDLRPFGNVNIYAEQNVTKQIKRNMPYCFKKNLYPGVPQIVLNNIDEKAFYIGKEEIQPIRVYHADLAILGYRIGAFAYLTDVKTIEQKTYEQLTNLDMLVINALRVQSHISHINIQEAMEIAEKIGAKKTYFTHFSHDAGLHENLQHAMPQNIFIPYDNLVIEL
jgi:phosphoribosyl 1,2-cyclic phosphate phosphodiesterase